MPLGEHIELFAIEHTIERARAYKKYDFAIWINGRVRTVVPEHRHKRNHARSASNESEGSGHICVPDKRAADGAADFHFFAGLEFPQIWRDLAVFKEFNAEFKNAFFAGRRIRRRGDGIASLGLITV